MRIHQITHNLSDFLLILRLLELLDLCEYLLSIFAYIIEKEKHHGVAVLCLHLEDGVDCFGDLVDELGQLGQILDVVFGDEGGVEVGPVIA